MKLVIETTQHSTDTLISIIQETSEASVIERTAEIDNIEVACAIAEKNEVVTAEILTNLYSRYADKPNVVKTICKNIIADSALLHEIYANRNKHPVWAYQDILYHPNVTKEDLQDIFDDLVKCDIRIAFKFAMDANADKDILIKILYLAYEKKDFDLLVTLLKNPKINKEDLL